MKTIGRVWFSTLDGLDQIRLLWKAEGVIEFSVSWPDGKTGVFVGYTLNGYLKYKEIE